MRVRRAGVAALGAALAGLTACAGGAGAAPWTVHENVSRGPATFPEVAIDARGGATVTFRRHEVSYGERRSPASGLEAAHRKPGGRFGAPYPVGSARSTAAGLLAAPDGTTVLMHSVRSDCGVFGNICPEEVRVSIRRGTARFGQGTVVARGAREPRLGIDRRGRPTAIWLDDHTNTSRSLMAAALVDGRWRTRELARGNLHQPALAVGARGDALAAWQSVGPPPASGPPTIRLVTAFWRAGGEFGAPRAVGPADRQVTGPAVAVDAKGNALLGFGESPREAGAKQAVLVTYRPFGKGFGAIRQVDDDSYGPRILIGPSGQAVVQYQHFRQLPSQETLFVSRSAAGRWSKPATIVGKDMAVDLDFGKRLLALVRPVTATDGHAYALGKNGFAKEQSLTNGAGNPPIVDAALGTGHAIAAWFGREADSPVSVALREP